MILIWKIFEVRQKNIPIKYSGTFGFDNDF